MILQTWSEVLAQSFQDLWVGVIGFVPNIVMAIIIFVAGWIVGGLVGELFVRIVRVLKVDGALRGAGLESILNRTGHKLDSGRFVGALVKWFVVAVFLIASFDVLGLQQVNQFLQQVVVLYLPQVIVAVLILLIGAVVGDIMQSIVVGSARAAQVKSSRVFGNMVKWAIWIFAILMALTQLGIAVAFIQTLFTGVVVAASLALGLSFGLGGKDAAARYIEETRRNWSE